MNIVELRVVDAVVVLLRVVANIRMVIVSIRVGVVPPSVEDVVVVLCKVAGEVAGVASGCWFAVISKRDVIMVTVHNHIHAIDLRGQQLHRINHNQNLRRLRLLLLLLLLLLVIARIVEKPHVFKRRESLDKQNLLHKYVNMSNKNK